MDGMFSRDMPGVITHLNKNSIRLTQFFLPENKNCTEVIENGVHNNKMN